MMRALARGGEGDASKSAQREALAQAGKLWFLGARVLQPHLRRHSGMPPVAMTKTPSVTAAMR